MIVFVWFKEVKQFMSNLMSPSCHHLNLHGTVVKDRVLEMVPPFYHPDMLLMWDFIYCSSSLASSTNLRKVSHLCAASMAWLSDLVITTGLAAHLVDC